MVKYELPGEPLIDMFPAHVEIIRFQGVDVYRIIGDEGQITDTTKIIDDLYSDDAKRTFGDAMHIGYGRARGGRKPIPMYELIVLRKVTE